MHGRLPEIVANPKVRSEGYATRWFYAWSFSPGTVLTFLTLALMFVTAGHTKQNPSQTPPPPPGQPDSQAPNFAIQRDVNFVVLHASVLNDRGQFVSGLKLEDFRVLEDKIPQKISVFRQEDVPVSMGLVIDNSGSMRPKEDEVKAAALTFIKTGNPEDEAFVVNFNEDFYLDTVHDFTSDLGEMRDALDRMQARGSTALYDAVIASLDHLKKGSKDKKVLLVITDGVDNASRRTLQNAVQEAQHSDALIYAIGLFTDDELKHNAAEMRRARKALTDLASATGGREFFPESVNDTEAICTQIARDIRNQYTLAYYPTNEARDSSFRSVQVTITSPPGKGKLSVRTRTGYYAKSLPRPASGN
jgi:Ca-activated chloride channel homolog